MVQGADIGRPAREGEVMHDVKLKPCPFCGAPPYQHSSLTNPWAACKTARCWGAKLPIVSLDNPPDVAAWNTRAELAGAIKSRNAAMMMYEAARQSRDDLLMQQHEWQVALATLEGEREANALLTEENERLRTALTISTNGLRHCSRWNISKEKEKALMAVVMENETILKTHNVQIEGAARLLAQLPSNAGLGLAPGKD